MSDERLRWLLKVIQPERTLASLPGGANPSANLLASLLNLPVEVYANELGRMHEEASHAAADLLADPVVAAMVDHLPLKKGANIVAFGDSLTSEPQSWAVILRAMLAMRRPDDGITVTINAVAGETTAHALVRAGSIAESRPNWVLFLIGTNDARTQGRNPTKTLVHHEESERNFVELRNRVVSETEARCLWVTPPAVNEKMVASHWGLSMFGVRFKNDDLARVADIVRKQDGPIVDLFAMLGAPTPSDLMIGDGLHFNLAGQQRLALEVVRSWSRTI